MPEDLPTPNKSLEEIEREKNKVCEELQVSTLYEIKW